MEKELAIKTKPKKYFTLPYFTMPATALFDRAPAIRCVRHSSAPSVVCRAFSSLLLSTQQQRRTRERLLKLLRKSLYSSKFTGRNASRHISSPTALQCSDGLALVPFHTKCRFYMSISEYD